MAEVVASASAGGFSSTVNLTMPAEIEPGDLLLVTVTSNDEDASGIHSAPSGLSLVETIPIGSSNVVYLYERDADGSEPGTYSFTWAASHQNFVTLTAARGAAGIRIAEWQTGTGQTARTIPAMTAEPSELLWCWGFHWSLVDKAWSGGTTYLHQPRGSVLAYEEYPQGGPITQHVVTGESSGNMLALGALIAPTSDGDHHSGHASATGVASMSASGAKHVRGC